MSKVSWDTYEKIFRRMDMSVLVDLTVFITKDAVMPGGASKRALLGRQPREALISGLKDRHFKFKTIVGDFDEWLDRKGRGCFDNKICPRIDEECSLRSCCDAKRECIISDKEVTASEIIQKAKDYPDCIWSYRSCVVYSDAPTLGAADNLFFRKCVYKSIREKMSPNEKIATDSNLRYRTMFNRVYGHALELGEGYKAAADKELITKQLNKGSTPAYAETKVPLSKSEIEAFYGIPPFSREYWKRSEQLNKDETAAAMRDKIDSAMKSNRDRLIEQTMEYYKQRVLSGLDLPDSYFGPYLKPDVCGDIERKMLDNLVQSCKALTSAEPRKPLLNGDFIGMKRTEKRGFPVYDGVPEVEAAVYVGEEKSDRITRPTKENVRSDDYKTDGDFQGIYAEGSIPWRAPDVAARIERLQKILDELEKENVVGSPFSLSEWCREPLCSVAKKK